MLAVCFSDSGCVQNHSRDEAGERSSVIKRECFETLQSTATPQKVTADMVHVTRANSE